MEIIGVLCSDPGLAVQRLGRFFRPLRTGQMDHHPDRHATRGGGSVDTSGAPASITLIGGNDGCDGVEFEGLEKGLAESESQACLLDYTIAAPAAGTVSFHWAYDSLEEDASYDLFLVLKGGTAIKLSDDAGASSQSGDYSFSVTAGQVFGFRLDCTDCTSGAATVVISSFSAPPPRETTVQAVPTLQEWALIAMAALMGLLAFTALRRQRQS